jgi:hypothetical protein
LFNRCLFNFNEVLQVIDRALFHHPLAHRDGKDGQQTVGGEEENKKEKHEFCPKAMNLHQNPQFLKEV